jgi:NADH-quinone oxidoreductase subunit G
MAYGKGKNRFAEHKRTVKEKYMGPLIKTHMTRCIHCTRCVRFITDIAGVEELGAVYRGEHMEISTYVEKSLTSELSGNIIDLCPVGALTSKPYAFKARPWELCKTESIDVMDAVGSNIRIDARGREVMRILPRLNEEVNEEWLDDRARFACDGLTLQRLDQPYIRKAGKLKPASWEEAYEAVAKKLLKTAPEKIAAIAGDMVEIEAMVALKDFLTQLGVTNIDCRQDGAVIGNGPRVSYLFNSTIAGIEAADAILLVGTDPRKEAAVLNARIRKRFTRANIPVALIGQQADLTYPYEYLGDNASLLEAIAMGTHAFAKVLENAKNPMIILGSSVLTRSDAEVILDLAKTICEKYGLYTPEWNGFNILHRAASRVGGLDVGFLPGANGKATQDIITAAQTGEVEVVYLLGADEIDTKSLEKTFVIYQGHHGDAGAHVADVIFPAAAYTEKSGTYVNTEGRVQRTEQAVYPVGEAKEDWMIIRELSKVAGKALPYLSLKEVRKRMAQLAPHLDHLDTITPATWDVFGEVGKLSAKPIEQEKIVFYLTNAIARASRTMAKCVSDILNEKEKAA